MSPRIASANNWARVEAIERNKMFLTAYRVPRELWNSGVGAIFPAGAS